MFMAHVKAGSGYLEILKTILKGARHDFTIATIWAAIPFWCLSIPSRFFNIKRVSNKIRIWWGALFTIFSIMLCIASIEYYKEYRDNFNQFLFGIFYDDTTALMKTIIAEYNLGMNLFIVVSITYLYVKIFRHWIDKEFITLIDFTKYVKKVGYKKILSIAAGAVFIFSVIVASMPSAQNELEEIEEKIDTFLNTAIIPPMQSLNNAITEFLHIMSQRGLNHFIKEEKFKDEIKNFFNTKENFNNLDDYMKREANGPLVKSKPQHIFLVVMESYDGWSMLPEYNSLKINSGLKQLSKDGLSLTKFMPASSSTMATLSSVITGLPDSDIRTNYQDSSKNPYPSSIAQHFKKLGYKPRFFIGGYPEWHKVKEFFISQGFEDVYTIPEIKNWKMKNEWGIDDESLFNFIYETLDKENDSQPSFVMIMSGANHAPYSIDLEAEKFSEEDVIGDSDISPYGHANIKTLGHFWYADVQMKKFIDKTNARFPNSIFAITGDHYGRHHIKASPPLFETSIVPLVLYGPNVLDGLEFSPETKVGSHFDIATTLIELIAEKGFVYHTIGNDLFRPFKPSICFSNQKAMNDNIIVSTNRFRKDTQLLTDNKVSKEEIDKLKKYSNTAHAIAWWRVMKGKDI